MDPKTIKVNDLKRELEARNLSAKGLKSQLVARLTNALKSECEKESGEKLIEPDGDTPEDGTDEFVEDEKKKDKEDDKKVSNEKDRSAEKLNFPEMPAIIVQPSKTAKSGKFDCAVMSLSLLLDYRQEDNKEHSFEVSLFAELFNEMMMRDFGFRIYRALIEAPEMKDDEKEKRKYDKKDDKKDRKDDKDDFRRKDDAYEMDSDRDDEESDDDDYDGDDKRDKDRKKKRKKRAVMVTHDPYLLLSFVYFDQSHCGYLLDKDMEEILYTLGLMLSRNQVRKLIQKVCKREMFRYRKLTDRTMDADRLQKSDFKPTLEELAAGNKKYIPSFKNTANDISEETTGNGEGSSRSLIFCNGALIDVAKMMEQLERSERARLEADEKLQSLQLELRNLNDINTTKEKQLLKLSHDLEEQSKKLKNTEDDLKKTKSESDKYCKALSSIRDGLQLNMNIADFTLQKSKSRSARNSPINHTESDSDNSLRSNKSKVDCKTEKESNGIDNEHSEKSFDNVKVKTEDMNATE